MIILLLQQRVADAQLVQHRFVCVALAVLLQDAFAKHLDGHLLLHRQIVGVRERAVVIDW